MKNEEKVVKVSLIDLKNQYAQSGAKIYLLTTSVAVDDETEEEYSFLFKKPTPASYDRYVKTMSASASKAAKSFALDNIVEEQRELLCGTFDEYTAMPLTIAEKLLKMLGYADSTSVKKL